MAKRTRNVGLEILEGLRQLKRGEHGRIVNVPSVASVREKTGLSQSRFAELLGVSVRTLQEWEQHRKRPTGAARSLLMVIRRHPKKVARALQRDVQPKTGTPLKNTAADTGDDDQD